MSKGISRILSFVVALALLISPMSVLADLDPNFLYGTVFDDTDQDGVFDEGSEFGIDGVAVELYVTGDTTPSQTTTTSGGGLYSFEIITNGFYTVKVSEIAGTVDSTPDLVNFEVDSATPIPLINFGKVSIDDLGSISGTVYDDLDRDGIYDLGEDDPLEGVTVTLYDSEGGYLDDYVTDTDGEYEFIELFSGSYTVVETDLTEPIFYYSTTPNTVMVTLELEGLMEAVVDFGDFVPEEGEFPKIDLLLMKYFGIALLEFQDLRGMDGWGYGNIAKAYFLSQLSGEPVASIIAMRDGMGWGNIMKDVLGHAGLKGYNLGMIVSGRETPQGVQNLMASCPLIGSAEQAQELYAMGASNGAIKKACKLAQEAGNEYGVLVEALGLLQNHNLKQVREILQSENTTQAQNTERNSTHGPPACKGKNKDDPGCNN